jgi:hypothetical protein
LGLPLKDRVCGSVKAKAGTAATKSAAAAKKIKNLFVISHLLVKG